MQMLSVFFVISLKLNDIFCVFPKMSGQYEAMASPSFQVYFNIYITIHIVPTKHFYFIFLEILKLKHQNFYKILNEFLLVLVVVKGLTWNMDIAELLQYTRKAAFGVISKKSVIYIFIINIIIIMIPMIRLWCEKY